MIFPRWLPLPHKFSVCGECQTCGHLDYTMMAAKSWVTTIAQGYLSTFYHVLQKPTGNMTARHCAPWSMGTQEETKTNICVQESWPQHSTAQHREVEGEDKSTQNENDDNDDKHEETGMEATSLITTITSSQTQGVLAHSTLGDNPEDINLTLPGTRQVQQALPPSRPEAYGNGAPAKPLPTCKHILQEGDLQIWFSGKKLSI